MNPAFPRFLLIAVPVLLLSGCASVKNDSAFSDVKALVLERTGRELATPRTALEQNEVDARVVDLLRKPLNAGSAVQLAFLNNKRLRATLGDLNLSQADLLAAGQWRNPSLATSLRFPGGSGGGELRVRTHGRRAGLAAGALAAKDGPAGV